MRSWTSLPLIFLCVGAVNAVLADDLETKPAQETKEPAPNSADEPIAKEFSLKAAAQFLDAVSLSWTRKRKCGTCHTNYAYLFARPAVKGEPSAAMAEVRGFFENRARNWDTAKPLWDTEVVATAVALSVNDAAATGRLHPATRIALDRMWTLQREDGSWDWLKCNWPPMEHDDYFGAVYAAVGVGSAPEGYSSSDAAKAGVEKLRSYLRKNPAPDLHHKAMLLWASTKLEGLLDSAERERVAKDLLALQKADGSWSVHSLASWKRHDGSANQAAEGDAYGTAFVAHVLGQTRIGEAKSAIAKASEWLRKHQRESGRWFVRSPSSDDHHFISHAATAYAVLVLSAASSDKPAAGD